MPLIYSSILDSYYTDKKQYMRDYQRFRYECFEYVRIRHSEYMKNYYKKKQYVNDNNCIVKISHEPIQIQWK
jgi:hypothetical protein